MLVLSILSLLQPIKRKDEFYESLLMHNFCKIEYQPTLLQEALATGARIATNQLMYNLVSRAIEFEVMPLCQKNDIGVICYSPLLQGKLYIYV